MYSVFEKLLKDSGLTASEFCRAIGIRPGVISDWKYGRYTPKADKLQLIADYFGVSLEYLTTGQQKEGYYLNPETAAIAQAVFEDPELRILFDAARDVKPENIRLAAEMLKRMKETNPDG